jgi:hypothetical protein
MLARSGLPLFRYGLVVAVFALVTLFASMQSRLSPEVLRTPCLPGAPCDCAACAVLLSSLSVSVPEEWGTASTCDCDLCSTVTRLLLRQLALGTESTLPVHAASLGSQLSSPAGMQRLTSSLARLTSQQPAAAAAVEAGAVPAPATAAAAAAVPMPAPAAAAAAAAPAAATLSLTTTSSASSGGFPGGSGAGSSRPAWLLSRSIRGWPAPACAAAAAFGASSAQCAAAALALPTRCIVGTHRAHWDFFTRAVSSSTAPFALMRYVDGERMILQGTQVSSSSQAGSEDKWFYDGGETQLARDMAAGLLGHHGEPVFYAFASPQDDDAGLKWYMERTEATCEQVTYANLWINGLYTATRPFLEGLLASQAQRIVLVANHEGVDKFGPCLAAGSSSSSSGLLGCISLPDQAVYTWEEAGKRQAMLDSMLGWAAKAPPGTLFVVCGGPLSKPLIHAAWSAFPVHQYVDFGSSLDEVLKGRKTRPCECAGGGGEGGGGRGAQHWGSRLQHTPLLTHAAHTHTHTL